MALTEQQETTIVFDERVDGFPTFLTYIPSSGLSINNRHFSFGNGGVYEHNSPNVARGTFYGDKTESTIEVVFNDNPSTVKDFWSIGYEGTEGWTADLSSDLDSVVIDETTIPFTRSISASLDTFINKEGKFYSQIQGIYTGFEMPDLTKLAVIPVGEAQYEDTVLTFTEGIPFEVIQSTSVGDIDYIGDRIFYYSKTGINPTTGETTYNTDDLKYAGIITNISETRKDVTVTIPIAPDELFRYNIDADIDLYRVFRNDSSEIQQISFSTFSTDNLYPIWSEIPVEEPEGGLIEYNIPTLDGINDNDFFITVKNEEAETSSLKGFFCTVKMKNNERLMAELFSVDTELSISSS